MNDNIEKYFPDPAERAYQMTFRNPMKVEYASSQKESLFGPICPRCRQPLRRTGQNYCTECGQKLDWSSISKIDNGGTMS